MHYVFPRAQNISRRCGILQHEGLNYNPRDNRQPEWIRFIYHIRDKSRFSFRLEF